MAPKRSLFWSPDQPLGFKVTFVSYSATLLLAFNNPPSSLGLNFSQQICQSLNFCLSSWICRSDCEIKTCREMLHCWNLLLYCRSWNSPHLHWGANIPPSQADAGCEGGCLSIHLCALSSYDGPCLCHFGWWDRRIISSWLCLPPGNLSLANILLKAFRFLLCTHSRVRCCAAPVQTPANRVSVPSVPLSALHLLPALQDRRHRGCPAPFCPKPDLLLQHNSSVGI